MKKNNLIPITILVTFLYIGSFLLIAYDGSLSFLGSSTNFLKAMVNTFQGAGAIAIITTILIFFQTKIQSKVDEDKKVFDEKIKLFTNILEEFEKCAKDGEVDKQEFQTLWFWSLKIGLLCDKGVVQSFTDILNKLYKNNGIYGEFADDIQIFVETHARKELKLNLDENSTLEDNNLSIFSTNSIEEEKQSGEESLSSSIFDFDILSNDIQDKEKGDVSNIYKSIQNKLGEETIESNFSKTGGCTIKVKSKKLMNIVPKKNFVELLVLRDHEKQYKKPKIKGLDILDIRKYDPTYDNHTLEKPHPSYTVPWGYAFYKIKLNYDDISKYNDKIAELAKSGYNTIINDKVLKVTMNNHEELKDIYGQSWNFS